MMRETIKRMPTLAAMPQDDVRALYTEYTQREVNARMGKFQPTTPVLDAPSNVCGCGMPADDHVWKGYNKPQCPVVR